MGRALTAAIERFGDRLTKNLQLNMHEYSNETLAALESRLQTIVIDLLGPPFDAVSHIREGSRLLVRTSEGLYGLPAIAD